MSIDVDLAQRREAMDLALSKEVIVMHCRMKPLLTEFAFPKSLSLLSIRLMTFFGFFDEGWGLKRFSGCMDVPKRRPSV
jgi:hypothetical protein